MKVRRVSAWDFVRAPFICAWIACFAVMPGEKTIVRVLFVVALTVSIITFIFQKMEDKKLQELIEEHNDWVSEWRALTDDDGKMRDEWKAIRYGRSNPRIELYADILKPFLENIPSWSSYSACLKDMKPGLDHGPVLELAEWVYYAQRGKVPSKYKGVGKSQICPYSKQISSEMRLDFFMAIDNELRKHGVESDRIIIADRRHYLMDQYMKHTRPEKIPPDAEFTWAANCVGESIEHLLLRGAH